MLHRDRARAAWLGSGVSAHSPKPGLWMIAALTIAALAAVSSAPAAAQGARGWRGKGPDRLPIYREDPYAAEEEGGKQVPYVGFGYRVQQQELSGQPPERTGYVRRWVPGHFAGGYMRDGYWVPRRWVPGQMMYIEE